MRYALTLLVATPIFVLAESKIEHELRLQLAATEAARAASDNARSVAERRLLEVTKRSNTEAVKASKTAQSDASNAAIAAAISTELTRHTAEQAQASAESAKLQASQLQKTVETGYWVTGIVQAAALIGGAFAFLGAWLRDTRARNWAQEDAKKKAEKLEQIHILVNSALTAAKQDKLDVMKSNFVALNEIIHLKTDTDRAVDPTSLEVVTNLERSIRELQAEIDSRNKSTEQANSVVEGVRL